jgi:prevent-host-death family protein
MSETLSLAEVKAQFSEVARRVNREHERVTVTVHGKPTVAVLAVDDLEALEETIAVLSDSELMRQLIEAERQVAAGETATLDDVRESVARRRPA